MRPRDDYQPPSDASSNTIHIFTDEEEYLTERRERLDELSTEATASIGGSEMASSDDRFASDLSSLIDDADADDEDSSDRGSSSSRSTDTNDNDKDDDTIHDLQPRVKRIHKRRRMS
ncbi:predicted protein [Lichtheimia corymbifera JMRC:FSU:9682]|uniref:Uncharacterized protein n=1 Tax=Lichtheimia corymbifera JMRC:FSU:9682 TaxID=1263082 RepID=A0A068RS55_9FUNG|nr:predicted protein [Lichtheimia corymbifera JMRC:FSU:9682]